MILIQCICNVEKCTLWHEHSSKRLISTNNHCFLCGDWRLRSDCLATYIILAASVEKVGKMCRFRLSCAYAKYYAGLCSPFIHSVVFKDSVSGQWRPCSDCVDAQADLGTSCLHMPEDMFLHGTTHFTLWVTYVQQSLLLEEPIHTNFVIQWTLVISNSKGLHERLRDIGYFDIPDLRNWGKQLIEQPPLTEWICNLTPKLEIYWKNCGKEEKFLLRSNFSSFPQYFIACW